MVLLNQVAEDLQDPLDEDDLPLLDAELQETRMTEATVVVETAEMIDEEVVKMTDTMVEDEVIENLEVVVIDDDNNKTKDERFEVSLVDPIHDERKKQPTEESLPLLLVVRLKDRPHLQTR